MILGSFLGVGPTLKLKSCTMQCASCAILLDVDKVKELNNIFNV